MDKLIKSILKRIENEGYEAYIVGGFVRDLLLGKSSYDIDICTNALPKDLISIFSINQNSNHYGGFNLKLKKYSIDITTYRKERKYNNRHPEEIEYITNLFEDIKRRDFTINSFCMDKDDTIVDLLDAKKDLDSKIIRVIGDPDEKYKDDPLRMLRAIRFATTLNFEIEEKSFAALKNNYTLVGTLSNSRIKEELTKILGNENFRKGLLLLDETKISEVIGLKHNGIKYNTDILGMWAQIEIKKVDFSKTELDNINKLKQILKQRNINNYTLFNYGLYLSTVASEILDISKAQVNKIYKNLPIKSMKNIDINGQEIMVLLGIEPGKIISDIILDVRNKILSKELRNRKSEIKKYVIGKWQHE